jgi:hypothetical protein
VTFRDLLNEQVAGMILLMSDIRGEHLLPGRNPEEPRKFAVRRHEHDVLNLSIAIPCIAGIYGHVQLMQKFSHLLIVGHVCVHVVLIYGSVRIVKVLACVEIFWRYNGGLGSNVPVWQEGWLKKQLPGDHALRLIGEQVRAMLEAAAKEDGGIKNWYLRGLIGTELAYIETGLLAYAGQATKQQMENEKKSMRMQNLLSMLGECV